jgi:hypothetical protein
MSLQQAGPGIRSLVTSETPDFARDIAAPETFSGGFRLCAWSLGQVRTAAKYRADGEHIAIIGPAWHDAFSGR